VQTSPAKKAPQSVPSKPDRLKVKVVPAKSAETAKMTERIRRTKMFRKDMENI
jgi:hypothetical protein